MPAAQVPIVIEQGADFTPTWKVCWPNPDGSPGDPIDLTLYASAHLQIRSSYGASATLADLTTANGGLTLGGAAGTIAIRLAAASTAAWWSGEPPTDVNQKINQRPLTKVGVYDLRLISNVGNTLVVSGGDVLVTPSTTRPS